MKIKLIYYISVKKIVLNILFFLADFIVMNYIYAVFIINLFTL